MRLHALIIEEFIPQYAVVALRSSVLLVLEARSYLADNRQMILDDPVCRENAIRSLVAGLFTVKSCPRALFHGEDRQVIN